MDKRDKQVQAIEAAQKRLIESIDATKDLAEKADALLQKHKKSLRDERDAD